MPALLYEHLVKKWFS